MDRGPLKGEIRRRQVFFFFFFSGPRVIQREEEAIKNTKNYLKRHRDTLFYIHLKMLLIYKYVYTRINMLSEVNLR